MSLESPPFFHAVEVHARVEGEARLDRTTALEVGWSASRETAERFAGWAAARWACYIVAADDGLDGCAAKGAVGGIGAAGCATGSLSVNDVPLPKVLSTRIRP